MDWLKGKKTYLVSSLMVASSLFNMLTGESSLVDFVSSPHFQTLLEGVGLSTLRAGVNPPSTH